MAITRSSSLGLFVGLAIVVTSFGVGYRRTATARQALIAHPTLRGTYRDGSFTGWGRSPHGRIQATVEIRRGRIASAHITTCRTRYPCSMIAALPPQVAERQSSEVDLVSGATQSAQAFARAVDAALAQAVRP